MTEISIWFMFDNHTFARVKSRDRNELVDEATNLFNEDGCGSLFVRDAWDAILKGLDLHGRPLGDGHYGVLKADVEQWADKVLAEISFHKLMVA